MVGFVLKRTVHLPGDDQGFPASIVMENQALMPQEF